MKELFRIGVMFYIVLTHIWIYIFDFGISFIWYVLLLLIYFYILIVISTIDPLIFTWRLDNYEIINHNYRLVSEDDLRSQ